MFIYDYDCPAAYICSSDNNNGMHKCNNLPRSQSNGVECFLSVDDHIKGRPGCVNWNKVQSLGGVILISLCQSSQYYTRCATGPTNPFHGAISFDNIGLAWVAIFLVISLEGWTDVMYFVQVRDTQLYNDKH